MPEQRGLPLVNGLQVSYARAGGRLLSAIEMVIQLHVPKRVVLAEEIGIKEGHLADALHGNGKHFAVTWLAPVCRYDREHRIARLIAGWHGLDVLERKPITDTEWRRRVEAELHKAGPAGGAILTAALDDPPKLQDEDEEPPRVWRG